jgi:hypothetical protein
MELIHSSLKADANLKAYYRMEPGALTTDSSGNAKTLTESGDAGEIGGKYGGGAGLNYGAGSLFINDNLGITTGNQWHSFWLLLTEQIASGAPAIFKWRSGDTNDLELTLIYDYNAGTPRLNLRWGRMNVAYDHNYYTVTLPLNVPIHFVAIKNTTGTKIQLYMNNVLVIDGTYTTGNGSGTTAASFAILGVSTGEMMDDYAILGDVPTVAEIAELYEGEKPQFMQML